MWLDVLFDGLEKLVDKLRERWPRTMFWTVVALWSAAAAVPAIGAAADGAGWFSILLPLSPLVVIVLTYFVGVERIPTPAWVAALVCWAIIPGGVATAGPKDDTGKTAVAVFLFCYGQLLVALLTAICVRRGFPVQSSFVQLRLTRLRLVAAAFPLAVSFRSDATAPTSAASWHEIAWPLVWLTALLACAFPSRGKARVAAIAIAFAAWAVLAHAEPHERGALVAENGWLWLTGCYQWLRASRQDFWDRGGRARPGSAFDGRFGGRGTY